MKTPFFLTCLFAIFLTSCNDSSPDMEGTPTVMTVEVTQIVQITTTPIPTVTIAPSPPIDQSSTFATDIAKRIGTPIGGSNEYYETSSARVEELQSQMAKLLPTLEAYYRQSFTDGLDRQYEFRNFHAEWEDFSDRECKFRSHLGSSHYPQMVAPINYNDCMVSKYENRLREYQIEISGWTN